MAGFTLSERETARLQEVVDACRVVDDEPIPWQVLEGLRDLLHTDDISLGGYCTSPAHVWFMNGIDHTGRFVDEETPEEALSNPFWQHYWSSTCSYPDRTGDYDSVTTLSDFLSVRQLRPTGRSGETAPYRAGDHGVHPAEPGPPAQDPRLAHHRVRLHRPGPLRPHAAAPAHPGALPAVAAAAPADGGPHRTPARGAQPGPRRLHQRADRSPARPRGRDGATHLKHVFDRLGVGSRTAAVMAVYGEPSPG